MFRKLALSAMSASLFFGLASGAQAADASTCALKMYTSLNMQTLPNGVITVPITIDDHELNFSVNLTGAVSTIYESAAKQVNDRIHSSSITLTQAGRPQMDHAITGKDVSIGVMHGKDMEFIVDTSPPPPGIDGRLGPGILRNYDIELDFAGGKVNFFSPDHCPDKAVYWAADSVAIIPMKVDDDGHIRISAKLDGADVSVIISSANTVSIMSMSAASEHFQLDEKSPGMKSLDAANVAFNYPFKTLSFGGVTINNPNIVLGRTNGIGADIAVSIGILRQMHVYIAYKEKKLYLTSATAH